MTYKTCHSFCVAIMLVTCFFLPPADAGATTAQQQLSKILVRQAQEINRSLNQPQFLPQKIHQLRSTLLELESTFFYNNAGLSPTTAVISPPGTISGSCSLNVGGNFFSPDTHITCSIYGIGAVAYEVNVKERSRDKIAFKGKLNPALASQDFTTTDEQVGGKMVTYEIFVFNQTGNRQLIHTFKSQKR